MNDHEYKTLKIRYLIAVGLELRLALDVRKCIVLLINVKCNLRQLMTI